MSLAEPQSSLRDSFRAPANPGLKRWAIITRAYGAPSESHGAFSWGAA